VNKPKRESVSERRGDERRWGRRKKRTSRSKDLTESRDERVVVRDPLVDVSNVDHVEGVLRPREREVDVDQLERAVSERRDEEEVSSVSLFAP